MSAPSIDWGTPPEKLTPQPHWRPELRALAMPGDPDANFARAMHGRYFQDAKTGDGYVDMLYLRRYRPHPAPPSDLAPWCNLWGAVARIAAYDGDRDHRDVAARLAELPRVGRPPVQDRHTLTGGDREFVRLVQAGKSKSQAAILLGHHRSMAQKISQYPAVREALAAVHTKLPKAA